MCKDIQKAEFKTFLIHNKKNQKCIDLSFMATLIKILKELYILEKIN